MQFQPTLPLRGATGRRSILSCRPARFNPRSPCGERPGKQLILYGDVKFQPTLPLRGATPARAAGRGPLAVSTHAPLAGSDGPGMRRRCGPACFNPRSPCGERPSTMASSKTSRLFQPTLPLRGATRSRRRFGSYQSFQPTLPLRGATATGTLPVSGFFWFQPTLPLRGATSRCALPPSTSMFQPTLPLRGATWACRRRGRASAGFNPRSPCGERRAVRGAAESGISVSTHAPLAGSDSIRFGPSTPACSGFNPRSPCGERRWSRPRSRPTDRFNPRSPCGERRRRPGTTCCQCCFNPRSPCGERHDMPDSTLRIRKFQPTLPLRGATDERSSSCPTRYEFQPTLPLRGATSRIHDARERSLGFNPRSPCGERRTFAGGSLRPRCFNPRSPCGERRSDRLTSHQSPTRFNPRSPCGERRRSSQGSPLGHCFNPRSPCGERRQSAEPGTR